MTTTPKKAAAAPAASQAEARVQLQAALDALAEKRLRIRNAAIGLRGREGFCRDGLNTFLRGLGLPLVDRATEYGDPGMTADQIGHGLGELPPVEYLSEAGLAFYAGKAETAMTELEVKARSNAIAEARGGRFRIDSLNQALREAGLAEAVLKEQFNIELGLPYVSWSQDDQIADTRALGQLVADAIKEALRPFAGSKLDNLARPEVYQNRRNEIVDAPAPVPAPAAG